jgi:hypothetical protein
VAAVFRRRHGVLSNLSAPQFVTSH